MSSGENMGTNLINIVQHSPASLPAFSLLMPAFLLYFSAWYACISIDTRLSISPDLLFLYIPAWYLSLACLLAWINSSSSCALIARIGHTNYLTHCSQVDTRLGEGFLVVTLQYINWDMFLCYRLTPQIKSPPFIHKREICSPSVTGREEKEGPHSHTYQS